MPRSRTIPDTDVFAAVRRLLVQGGDKAVAFASVARATGLAAPTLVQRYGSRDGMVLAALLAAWDELDRAAQGATLPSAAGPKGAQSYLKSITAAVQGDTLALLVAEMRSATLRARAEEWRATVEGVLALSLGGGKPGRDAAAILFAAWQGQILWQAAGGKGFRLKDAVRRLS
jgi:AcrR family transcriptional regulator